MALKFKIKSLDGVDEALHSLYTKHTDDGFYYLDVEGAVSKTKVDEFRNNNVELLKDIDDLKKKYDGIDTVKYAELIKLAEEASGKKMVELSELEGMVEDRVKTMRGEYDGKITELTSANSTKTRQLEGLLIDSTVRNEAIKSKVQTAAIDDVLLRAKQTFKLTDGIATPYDAKENVIYGKDGESAMSINEWLGGLQKNAPHLFESSSGGGAPPGGSKGKGGDPSKMSAMDKISAGLEATG